MFSLFHTFTVCNKSKMREVRSKLKISPTQANLKLQNNVSFLSLNESKYAGSELLVLMRTRF